MCIQKSAHCTRVNAFSLKYLGEYSLNSVCSFICWGFQCKSTDTPDRIWPWEVLFGFLNFANIQIFNITRARFVSIRFTLKVYTFTFDVRTEKCALHSSKRLLSSYIHISIISSSWTSQRRIFHWNQNSVIAHYIEVRELFWNRVSRYIISSSQICDEYIYISWDHHQGNILCWG